jgi:hypothetical protein
LKNIISLLLFYLIANISFSQSNSPCSKGSFGIIKPFIGKWKEYTVTENEEIYIGNLESKIELDGCIISQRFESKDSSFSYLSFGYIDPSSNIWQETYVFNNGGISKYQWQIDGTDVLQRRIGGTRKLDYMHQLRLTNITENQYDVFEEHSYDGGKTWKTIELTRIKRIQK